MFTEAQKRDLVERCIAGEPVRAIIGSFGLDIDQAMEWLKKNYRSEMKAAKQEQIAGKA